MEQAPSNSSTQYVVMIKLNNSISAGKEVKLVASDGTLVASFIPSKSIQSIVISNPNIKANTTYSLYVDGTVNASITTSGVVTTSGSSGMQGGAGGNQGVPGQNKGGGRM